MRAVVIDDGELHWEDRPDPEVGDTELLVAVAKPRVAEEKA